MPRLQSDLPNHFVLQHSGNLLAADKNIEWHYCKSSQNLIMLHKGQDFKTYNKRGEQSSVHNQFLEGLQLPSYILKEKGF